MITSTFFSYLIITKLFLTFPTKIQKELYLNPVNKFLNVNLKFNECIEKEIASSTILYNYNTEKIIIEECKQNIISLK